jgi:hypothetical protein
MALLEFSSLAVTGGERVSTMLRRPGSGLNFSGMLSHVVRPIMTALRAEDLLVLDVSSLKYRMSPGSFHGRVPLLPIPKSLEAATTSWNVRFIGPLGMAVAEGLPPTSSHQPSADRR